MAVSILHRATGTALTFAGLGLLAWWLLAAAKGQDAYDRFSAAAHHPLGLVVLIGLTWSFFQHTLSGVRHLTMDSGQAFELDTNKRFAVLTVVGSLLLTAAVWFYLLGGRA